jgi:hypothetical protein
LHTTEWYSIRVSSPAIYLFAANQLEPCRIRASITLHAHGGLREIGDQSRFDERDDLGSNASPAGGLAISANDWRAAS